MTRICIAGGPRTGKTTLSNEIAERTVTCMDCGVTLSRLLALASGLGCASHGDNDDVPVFHTDDVMHLGWSEASQHVADEWLTQPDPWIIEGVAVPRALRKWLAAHPEGKPCDQAIWLSESHEDLTPGQRSMSKGCEKVWDEIEPELRRRGVEIVLR